MKSLNSLEKRQICHDVIFDIGRIRAAVLDAQAAFDNARSQCLRAGQMLNDVQGALPHGDFQNWIETNLPELSYRTAARWAAAAANITRHLPPPDIEVDGVVLTVSQIMDGSSDLPDEAAAYRQAWLDFTADKTISECLAGVFVDGDPDHRLTRAINGKTLGGQPKGAPDRKDYALFASVKMLALRAHLDDWAGQGGKLSALQQAAMTKALESFVLGGPMRVAAGGATRAVPALPRAVADMLSELLTQRRKQKDA